MQIKAIDEEARKHDYDIAGGGVPQFMLSACEASCNAQVYVDTDEHCESWTELVEKCDHLRLIASAVAALLLSAALCARGERVEGLPLKSRRSMGTVYFLRAT